jgi:hypothetical protein
MTIVYKEHRVRKKMCIKISVGSTRSQIRKDSYMDCHSCETVHFEHDRH